MLECIFSMKQAFPFSSFWPAGWKQSDFVGRGGGPETRDNSGYRGCERRRREQYGAVRVKAWYVEARMVH